ncbi:hypothetical protein [Kitasatospora sp. NPDC085464]|uniref:hypothetical protein n=1 Tax=Kitasatospora sp. NPDC085464 TaxID=3364063 RepID=UPI0037CAEE1C
MHPTLASAWSGDGVPSGGSAPFGSKFAVLRPGTLRVGDELVVEAWGPSEL